MAKEKHELGDSYMKKKTCECVETGQRGGEEE